MSPNKRTIGERVHGYLAEAPGQQFVVNKWRFWWPCVAGFALVNALLTAAIFRDGDALQDFMGGLMVAVAGLVCWICVAALHYSDSPDKRLARGVAGLDSAALIFVILHFATCMYIFGHLHVLRGAERKYDQQVAAYNAEAKQVSGDSVKIAASAEAIARENTKRAKLENDTTYQQRRIIEAGGIPRSAPRAAPAPGAAAPALTAAQVQLAAPVKPEKSSAAFLAEWDAAIRALNFGELLLSVLTLILIRNRSAKTNSPTTTQDGEFLSVSSVSSRSPLPRPALVKTATQSDTVSRQNAEHKETTQDDTAALKKGLKVLREQLRLIAFHTPGRHYKADIRGVAVWVRAMTSDAGIQRTGHGAKAKLSILRDALRMPPDRFRAKLEQWLEENGFFDRE